MPAPHVLVLDDRPEICEIIRETLEEEGFRVSCGGSVADGERIAATERVDLAVIDAIMPGASPVKLASRLAASGARIVVMSGHVGALERFEGLPCHHLRKPFRLHKMLEIIRGALPSAP